MDADQALAEVGKVNERLKELDAMLHRAVRDPASQAVPLLHQQIADTMTRKELLTKQLKQIQRSSSYPD
jgi:hypothetical protein